MEENLWQLMNPEKFVNSGIVYSVVDIEKGGKKGKNVQQTIHLNEKATQYFVSKQAISIIGAGMLGGG